ncbi:MAG: helicase C-terminal domain-containing protein [Thermoanaerobaculia bacterium]|nr:helicase C-terminal domain-containing protein [Thermoanaerobaculia bacterium]
MPPRFDDERSRLEVSVADLIDRDLLGSIGFGNRGGYERMWLGQAIHSRYQGDAEADDATYRREVAVRHEMIHRGWEIVIRGRIDGLRRDSDGSLVVEEIKSVRRGGRLSPAAREVYQRQALLYAWIVKRERDLPVRAELVLIEIGSDAVEREELETSWKGLEAAVRRRLSSLIRDHENKRRAAEKRRRAALELEFPYPEVRPGQEEIVEAVSTAMEQREHLLIEAPTGIGKTVAALYPALRYALAHDKRVFVLTAKNLQQEMSMEVLELLNREEAFHSLRVRAKARMCANGEVICHEEYCPYARDYYAKLKSGGLVPALLEEHPTLDPDTIFRRAEGEEVCPFEVSLDLSRRVQVVVCDYNYAFDPYVGLSDFSDEADLSDLILIVDEIHNLVERGRGYYSPSLTTEQARRVASEMGRKGTAVAKVLAELALDLRGLIEEVAEETLSPPGTGPGSRASETPLPEERIWELRPRFDEAFVDYLEYQRENKAFRADDPFVELYFDFLRFVNAMILVEDSSFSTLISREGKESRLRILCKDPSPFLGRILQRAHSAVGLSATLSPTEFYRDLLGFEPHRTVDLRVPNPFPDENRCVVLDPTVETTYRQRSRAAPRIAERLAAFADAVPGNCLVLFSSYSFLAEMAELTKPSSKRVLVQQRTDGSRARQEILETLRSAMFRDILLLAVAGGVFAEGVDYPGEILQGVAVVGPCLPAVTLERELLRDYYQERFERGFEYAYVVPGMTRVVQAAGRLLRSPEDRGVITLLGRRFLSMPYRRYLPEDWLPPEGADELLDEPGRAASRFFRGTAGA